ncbi:stage II sporulation protein M [Chlamydia psittaci]|uniref:stage II sporulation protein M n=2 Tax=Chlamydia psittaci TaxID=83554 RepID=UPI00027E146E|nr:stage II sporulation protein M [Chlamydia psittaci]EPJ24813.1 incA family protein [Chlamydia psittaci 09DC77]EPJ29696.1 incA family protein [Chlamydia psittaci 09DC78]AFS21199.1 putative inner membrane protein [Chlamydia psittaci MN]AFS26810.1 putative inner membrane protein [Chlamydia psittaci CP3]KPZ35752.1 membrane protein [Chlamydia psittaci CP3]
MSEQHPIHQSSRLNQIEIGKSFLDHNPKVARALQIVGIILSILAIVSSVFLVVATPVGLPISMALGGVLLGIGGSALFTSINSLASSVKKAAIEKKRQNILIQEKSEEIEVGHQTNESIWPKYNKMVDRFANLNMRIGKHERSILKQMGREEGLELIENLDRITGDYIMCTSLLGGRQEVYSEEDYAQRDDSYSTSIRKNDLLIKLGNSIISKLSQGGGVFSLKLQPLSKTMSKVHTGVTLGLVAGGLAAVGVIAAFIPGGILAFPLILASAIGIGLAVLGLSYAIKTILKRSKTNKKQLLNDLKSEIDIDALKDMTRHQHVLMGMLRTSLQTDQRMTLDHKDFYQDYNKVRDALQMLNEHLDEIEFKYKHTSESYQRRADSLEKTILQLSDLKNASEGEMYYPQVPSSDRAGLLSDTAGFDEMVAKGVQAARERRQKDLRGEISLGDYSQYLDEDELAFGDGWSPSGKRALETMWSAKPTVMNEEDYLILNGDVNKVLRSYRNDILRMKADIARIENLFEELQAGKQRIELFADRIIDIWHNVSSDCHEILNHLVGMQMRLVSLVEHDLTESS